MNKMKILGSVMFMGGLLIAFGAVGGMETTPGYLLAQIATAISGLFLMAVGARLVRE